MLTEYKHTIRTQKRYKQVENTRKLLRKIYRHKAKANRKPYKYIVPTELTLFH